MKPLNEAAIALRQLSKELMRRWGKQKGYRPEQVIEAAEAVKAPADSVAYGHARFGTKPDFEAHYQSRPDDLNYEGLRAEIAGRFGSRQDAKDPNADAAVVMMMMG